MNFSCVCYVTLFTFDIFLCSCLTLYLSLLFLLCRVCNFIATAAKLIAPCGKIMVLKLMELN